MLVCLEQNKECNKLILHVSKSGLDETRYFECSLYPNCNFNIPLDFNENKMTREQKNVKFYFAAFAQSWSYLYTTYAIVYFNVRNAAFLDYLLRADIVREKGNEEVGVTGAKIFNALFYYLYLIPEKELKLYLINNFPATYLEVFNNDQINHRFNHISGGIDHDNLIVDESYFIKYSDPNQFGDKFDD